MTIYGRGDGQGGVLGVGDELRQARIRRGRSLQQANQATRIALRYLEAIEAEDWDRMPAATYARGFISSYAQYLGLDPAPLLNLCPFDPTGPGEGLQLADLTVQSESELARSGQPSRELRSPRVQLGPWLAAIVVVLVVIAGVIALVTLRDEVEPLEEARSVPGINETVDETAAAEAVLSRSQISSEPLPNLLNFSAREAVNYVRLTGVPYIVVEVYDETAAGTVLEQSPGPGVPLSTSSVVTLVVSMGPRPGTAE